MFVSFHIGNFKRGLLRFLWMVPQINRQLYTELVFISALKLNRFWEVPSQIKVIWLLSCPWLGKLSLFACLTNVMELVFAQKTFSEKSYCNGSKQSLLRIAIALRSFQLLKLHLKLQLVCDVFPARFIEFLVCESTLKNHSHNLLDTI